MVRVQLLWQNLRDTAETVAVSEAEFADDVAGDAIMSWVENTLQQRQGECPDGWGPLVMIPERRRPKPA